ncbi:TPA: hypothetical protein R5R88_004592, partial [Salmonella enterica]|nr:hypothetical protein [Salmonella enterica]
MNLPGFYYLIFAQYILHSAFNSLNCLLHLIKLLALLLHLVDAVSQLLEIRRRRHNAGETDTPEVICFSYDKPGRMLTEETAQGILTHRYD